MEAKKLLVVAVAYTNMKLPTRVLVERLVVADF